MSRTRTSFRRRESGISAVARALLPDIALLMLSALDCAAQSQGRLQREETISPRFYLSCTYLTMNARQTELTKTLVDKLRSGALTEESLRDGIAAIGASGPTSTANGNRQDLLYLHSGSSSPSSAVQGISLFAGGREQELSSDPEEWPYTSVLDAIGKGWRVISFPDMSLLTLSADEFHGLGFLFVLERWS